MVRCSNAERNLQTHNVAMASPVADFVVSLGTDGRVASQGSMSKVLAKDKGLSKEIDEENKVIEKAEHTVDDQQPVEESKKSDGKLIVAEEISVGHISWPACTSVESTVVLRSDAYC